MIRCRKFCYALLSIWYRNSEYVFHFILLWTSNSMCRPHCSRSTFVFLFFNNIFLFFVRSFVLFSHFNLAYTLYNLFIFRFLASFAICFSFSVWLFCCVCVSPILFCGSKIMFNNERVEKENLANNNERKKHKETTKIKCNRKGTCGLKTNSNCVDSRSRFYSSSTRFFFGNGRWMR